jgi:ribosomal protein S6
MFLIRNMLASNEADKAYVTVKTFVKNSKTAEKLVQIFEEAGMRELAIKIETHF